MSLLNIDTSQPDLLKVRTFDPVPNAKYICEVENDLVIEDTKAPDNNNQVVSIILRILDDGEYKGRKIFDNLTIGDTPEARKKSDWKIAQFAVACGVCTKETLSEIDLEAFKGSTVEVLVGTKTSTYEGETKKKNVVKQYLFEGQDDA